MFRFNPDGAGEAKSWFRQALASKEQELGMGNMRVAHTVYGPARCLPGPGWEGEDVVTVVIGDKEGVAEVNERCADD